MARERIRVRLRGFDVELIDQSAKSIVQTVLKAGSRVSGPIPLPMKINKYTVLRSPHVHKKSREQFEMRTHKRLIDILEPTPAVMDALMRLELPPALTSRSSSEAVAMLALIGRKIGMTQVFTGEGMLVPVTVVQIEPNTVVRERTEDKNGYRATVLGVDTLKKSRARKPYAGQFPTGIEPTRYLFEFKNYDKECKVGDKLGVEVFEGVRFVDVRGTTKGKGFQGVMRRHGFMGGPGAHGSKFHREMGSVGTGAFRKIVKGSRMPGRMGNARLTVKSLRLHRVDKEKGLLLIKGAVPGRRGGMVVVLKAGKR